MRHGLLILLLLCAVAAQAQLYKWVGPDGKVNYTDIPPPASAKQVEKKSISSGGPGDVDLPFDLAEAVKNGPVTLFTAAKCVPCDDGRRLLTSRGIPFSEKTVSTNEDLKKLSQVSTNGQLPVLVVGREKQQGFQPGDWNAALSAMGYPEGNRLPKDYQNPKPEAAVPLIKPVAEKQSVAEKPVSLPKEARKEPVSRPNSGFQF